MAIVLAVNLTERLVRRADGDDGHIDVLLEEDGHTRTYNDADAHYAIVRWPEGKWSMVVLADFTVGWN